ncbi:FG-GAP repeat-containing protein [Roseibium sp. TrichSKD4]|uniref:FG-GAP repeat domain-containing protein n=1 Tax=Roseibium sp. TrichSKD4 TaxID=744980 RepID=UPI0001E574BA|nr:VCBS repeat-containing protein [Roseibium sp. TrichSKD4]EFO30835.1 FG-GAP repeat-containing protein [Roseibium sp. TrichSKD4]
MIGDAIEAAQLNIRTRNGKTLSLTLPQTEVFEDRTPRLADLDGDGQTEVITIRSSNRGGGSVTLYALRNGQLQEVGSTGFIGRANRWLNIAGIADYLGNGMQQVAYVEIPHIGGTLRLYEFNDGKMRQALSKFGFSNHAIGSRNLGLSATADMNGDGTFDLLVPDTRRSTLHALSFKGGSIQQLGKFRLPAPLETDIHTSGSKASTTFLFGLTNGRYYELSMP